MVRNETGEDNPDDHTADSDVPVICPLVRNRANREVLIDWIDGKEDVALADEKHDLQSDEFDCLIVDTEFLQEKPEALIELKERQELVLPILLLVEESEERRVRLELRQVHPEVFDAIDAVVAMPIAEYRLADQIESLLRIREQSRKLSAQRKQLRAIRDEHAGHGVVITDAKGQIEYVNQAYKEQAGYAKAELLGENPRILKSGEHSEAFYEDMWETILAGDVWHGEIINERKDGERFVVNMTIAPVTNLDGEIDRFIGVNHEITELKELEDSLRKRGEQLEILNRVLRHDIRNDMNVILGWTEFLAEYVDEEGEEYIERVLHSGRHIVELTQVAGDLVADITTGEDAEVKPVDIGHVLEEEVAKRKEAYSDATIELQNEIPSGTTVWANMMLASVFRNLINNAVQHNDTAHPRVTIRGTRPDGSVLVEIADDGPGVQDQRKEQIFEQSHKGLESEGTGLGLFLVHSLVDTYGGKVRIDDNDPRGAIFAVELPVVESEPPPATEGP